jgi:hypothetical protein
LAIASPPQATTTATTTTMEVHRLNNNNNRTRSIHIRNYHKVSTSLHTVESGCGHWDITQSGVDGEYAYGIGTSFRAFIGVLLPSAIVHFQFKSQQQQKQQQQQHQQ